MISVIAITLGDIITGQQEGSKHEEQTRGDFLHNLYCCLTGDLTAALALQPALKFNGGGHINHTIFWKNLSPNGGGEPEGK